MTEERVISGLAYLTNVHTSMQKVRIGTGNREEHLKKQGRKDKRASHLHKLAGEMEKVIERYIATDFKGHPAYPWLSQIRGSGMEAAAKVLGLIDGVTFKSTGRGGIEAFDTLSKLRRFAGLAPVNGQTEKVARGDKGIHYNPELRMMLWRLMTSLMKAVNYRCPECRKPVAKTSVTCRHCQNDIKDRVVADTGVWYKKYVENDEYYMRRCERDGIKVIPTPTGRVCPECGEEKDVPKTTFNCPVCHTKLQGKKEAEGIMFRGHIVNMAKRRTIRLWLDMLWLVWRKAVDLPTRSPYIEVYGGHEMIDPWNMVDK